ncbi:MAG: TerB family tellurite resistance protein [Halioglobus sp.]
MIGALKALFETPAQETDDDRQHRNRLAAAALLVETARADFRQDAGEEAAMERLLAESLNLPLEEVHQLVTAASQRVDEAVSLYEFTRTINDYYSKDEKLALVSAMWQVAYADGDLDKYEEHLIRQVAELIYVPHADYIKLKLKAAG